MQISRASLHSDSDLNTKVTKRITDREKLFILRVIDILQLIWPSSSMYLTTFATNMLMLCLEAV